MLQAPTKLKSGHFKVTFTGSGSSHITVTGTVKAKSASGRINVGYTLTIGTGIYACQFKAGWTAKKV